MGPDTFLSRFTAGYLQMLTKSPPQAPEFVYGVRREKLSVFWFHANWCSGIMAISELSKGKVGGAPLAVIKQYIENQKHV